MSDHIKAILNLQVERHCRQVTIDWLKTLMEYLRNLNQYVYSERIDGVALSGSDIEVSVLREQASQHLKAKQYRQAAAFMQAAAERRESVGGSIPLSQLFFEYAQIIDHIPGEEKIRLGALEIADKLFKKETEERAKDKKIEEALNIARMQLKPRWLRK